MKRLILLLICLFGLPTATQPACTLLTSILPGDDVVAQGLIVSGAYSTTRALYAAYVGNLYQIKRASDSTTLNIVPVAAGKAANTGPIAAFCANTTCVRTIVYDQSGHANNLPITAGLAGDGVFSSQTTLLNGAVVEGASNGGVLAAAANGFHYPAGSAAPSVPTGGQPETVYAVFSGSFYGGPSLAQCCFDFGNAETSETDTGAGHMHAVWYVAYAGGNNVGAGPPGPWGVTDFEDCGTATNYCGTGTNNNHLNTGTQSPFVTVLSKCDCTANMTIKSGPYNGPLTTWWQGALPAGGGYTPMHMEGSITLLTGGDISDGSPGIFYEGMIVAGQTTDATDNLIQTSVTQFYGLATYPVGLTGSFTPGIWCGSYCPINAACYVAPFNGIAKSVSVYLSGGAGTAKNQVGLYSYSSGPNTLMSGSALFVAKGGWNTIPLTTPQFVTAGTTYCPAFLSTDTAISGAFGGSGASGGSFYYTNAGQTSLVSPFPAKTFYGTSNMAIYLNVQ